MVIPRRPARYFNFFIHSKKRKMLKSLATLLLAVSLAACGGDSSGPSGGTNTGGGNVAGSYRLATVGAAAMPNASIQYTRVGTSCTARFNSGSLTLGGNGTFSLEFDVTDPCAGSGVQRFSGTYTVQGATVHLHDARNAVSTVATASLVSNGLIMRVSKSSLTYDPYTNDDYRFEKL
jgi:ABC-type amino acid transport substrate-binding protein